ncbi:MAG TPA: lactate utilization protein B [Miltoncostaeaceae bacterium]|nr:lactate utilization protein B [Miltoncostaeaceae bacterium]
MSRHAAWGPPFPAAAHEALHDRQLRANLAAATATIRDRRASAVGEVGDWEELREAGRSIKARTLGDLDRMLERLEREVTARGGVVHWAPEAADAADVVLQVARAHGTDEVVKVKSLATDEIELNERLAAAGVRALETDLAELICQLGGERSSHILVPAIHRNRGEIAALFRRTIAPELASDEPADIAEAARTHLRERFLRARVGVSGANFAVAETGTVCVVESEGNGRMCTTLPEALVTVCGIEKLLPAWRDLGVFLQLLPRSATGERMSPYTSLWSGVAEGDGPREFHLVLLDNGRTDALADAVGREALACIRCSACLNICPVYRRTGGHAYGSVYPGPIGAILTPLLRGAGKADSLPYASSLCSACADVCPVKIDIPRILVHLRGRAVATSRPRAEGAAMSGLARVFADERRYARAQRLARRAQRLGTRTGLITRLPGPLAAWSESRELPEVAPQTFREWWSARGR